jgi:addiction module RelE/StbE family toxin
MAAVRWTVGAREDLREIVEHIAADSPTYARAMAMRILGSVKRLRAHPALGRVVPEYEDESIRELIVGNYRVVYRVEGRRVGVLAVVHGARDLPRQRRERPWDLG